MSEASGFGIELEELRTMALISAAVVPAFGWVARGKDAAQMGQRAAIAALLVAGLVVLDVRMLRAKS